MISNTHHTVTKMLRKHLQKMEPKWTCLLTPATAASPPAVPCIGISYACQPTCLRDPPTRMSQNGSKASNQWESPGVNMCHISHHVLHRMVFADEIGQDTAFFVGEVHLGARFYCSI
nr:uncharacterized protein LOC119169043 [Rhipicephalus microplus]